MNIFARRKLKKLLKKAKYLQSKRDQGENVNLQHEIKILKDLARLYEKHQFDKHLQNAAILANEYYRAAAILGDAQSQYNFAQKRLEQGKFWDEFAQGFCGHEIHKDYARSCYEEAFEQLREAEKGGFALARRLHGMAYIHGWGVEQDQDKGFQLVVDSIDEEQAWDRATKIFEELGLNKPEFFQAIMTAKQKKL